MTLFERLAQLPPEQPAVVDGANSLQVGDLLHDAQRLAAGLVALGVKPGDTAVLAAQPDAGFVKIVYAAMLCGLRLAVIDPEMGRDNYRSKLRQLAPQWAFVDYRLLLLQEHPLIRWAYFRWSKRGIYFPYTRGLKVIATGSWLPIVQKHTPLKRLFDAPSKSEIPHSAFATPHSNEFLVTYTSGTTSEPKGVVHSLGALTASVQQVARLLEGGGNERLATHLPYFALIGLNAGVTAHLWQYASSAAEKLQFIENQKITTLFAPPCDYMPLIELCEEKGRLLPDSLQLLCFGSAPVYRSFLERLLPVLPAHTRLWCLYGMTENLVVAAIDGREKATLPTDGGDVVGRPLSGVEIRVADDGELFVRSPQLYQRYLHLPAREHGDWHATGDLGHLDAEGRVVLTGRKKDMLIRRNFNLYPGLYEPTINRIPEVTECAFVGVYDEKKHDETVVLFVETHRPLSEAALRRALENGPYSIDREALPDRIVFATLPRKGRQSKVDKIALREVAARL
jgi:acyl-CoA synthetase (AMP-forming)/AMP-acid ligase II